jgi:hypothetical protein
MQVVFNNVDTSGNQVAASASLVAAENAAAAILDSTFSNDITLVLNVGNGFIPGTNNLVGNLAGLGKPNGATDVLVTYDTLRPALLASGFFTDANLPEGENIDGISRFWISSSQAKALGFAEPNNAEVADGFIGVNSSYTGNNLIAALLHEAGHDMGRMPTNQGFANPSYPEFDLTRFTAADTRQFMDATGYFSLDNGVTPLVNFGTTSFADFRNPPNGPDVVFGAPPVDPYSQTLVLGATIATLTPLDIQVMQALGFTATPAAQAAEQAVALLGDPTSMLDGDPTSMLDPAPSDVPTANMVLSNVNNTTANTTYQFYNLGANSVSASNSLGEIGSDFKFVTLGNFDGTDPSDMLVRSSTTGDFQVYNISNNEIIGSHFMGNVGLEWQPLGFGFFGSIGTFGATDMLMRDVNTGDLQVYNIDNNEVTGSDPLGNVGLEWQFLGLGNFGSTGTSDMLMHDVNTGDLRVYGIRDNEVTGFDSLGTVGDEWQFSGVGNFSSLPDESDLLLRNSNTGDLQLYDISNNEVTFTTDLGNVGLEWQFAGVAPVLNTFSSDLILRNVNTGDFQVYNIADNHVIGSAPLGNIGLEWQLPGFASIGSISPPVEDLPAVTALSR